LLRREREEEMDGSWRAIPIVDDGDVGAEEAFPGAVKAKGDAGAFGRVKTEGCTAFESLDEVMIGEQFETIAKAERDDGGGDGLCKDEKRERQLHGLATGLG